MKRNLVAAAAATIVLGAAFAGSSEASFAGRVSNPGDIYSLTALYAPSSPTASTSGHDVQLGWSPGQNGSGYSVLGVANGSSSNCSGVSFSQIGTAGGTSYSDTGRYTPQGTWYCYEVKTSYASWTSVAGNPTVAARIGFFVTSVAVTNGGTAGRLDTGDVLVVTFNQPVTTSSGPSGLNSVCAIAGGTIMLGSTTVLGACSTSETVNLGRLTGGTAGANGRFTATWAWSNGNKTLTITLGFRTSGSTAITTSGTWTFDPTTTASKLESATGSFHVCDSNAGGGDCLPTVTGTF